MSIICVLIYINKCIYRWNDTCYSVTVRLVWYLHVYLSCHFPSTFNTVPNLESECDTSSSDCKNESWEENMNTVNRSYNTPSLSFIIFHIGMRPSCNTKTLYLIIFLAIVSIYLFTSFIFFLIFLLAREQNIFLGKLMHLLLLVICFYCVLRWPFPQLVVIFIILIFL